MPSELIEFLFFSAFMVLTVSTMGLTGWVFGKLKKDDFSILAQKDKSLRSEKIHGAHYNEP